MQGQTESAVQGQAEGAGQEEGAGRDQAQERGGISRGTDRARPREQVRTRQRAPLPARTREKTRQRQKAIRTKIITDHAGNQVEIPRQEPGGGHRHFPNPIHHNRTSGVSEKVVGMNPASMRPPRRVFRELSGYPERQHGLHGTARYQYGRTHEAGTDVITARAKKDREAAVRQALRQGTFQQQVGL